MKHGAAEGTTSSSTAARELGLRDGEIPLVDLLDRLVGDVVGGLWFAAGGEEQGDGGEGERRTDASTWDLHERGVGR